MGKNQSGDIMNYIIRTNGNSLSFTDVQMETGANGYETVRFTVRAASWGFVGSTDFSCDLSAFREFIAELKVLHDSPRNLTILRSAYMEQFLRFRPEQLGYTEVNGKLIRYYPRNAVEFEFLIDEAAMRRFVRALCRDFKL